MDAAIVQKIRFLLCLIVIHGKKQCPISAGLSGIIINGILLEDAGLTVNAGSALLSGKILSGGINHTCCDWADTKKTPPHF
ncbi:hypothetical protein BGI15_07835 [Snodgrassella alvi]|nr:hypothetical protein BGI07_08235 [Snodgrassella alvi]ORF32199.1 hypothetical protein BGI10_03390 [Snodgrassella alvi]ORF33489.1 hypothetical protein BGI11_08755 [Snodgrassella alvi]ORF38690.1 hypothetical protein BGI13_05830 [Snodgrassella alvi]ORF41508.1 hypothetical protein BGI14_02400 [Snodgrassella alvi]